MSTGGEIERASGFDLVAARLRADSSDLRAFVEGLAAKLEDAVPGCVQVERVRSGAFRGPKLVRRIVVEGGGERLELSCEPAAQRLQTKRARVSGGITLSSEPLDIEAWIEALSEVVQHEAEQSERTRQALERLLLG